MRKALTGALGLALVAIASLACSPAPEPVPPLTGGPVGPPTTATDPTSAAAATSPSAGPKLQFPNKTVNAFLKGWDAGHQMVLFQVAQSAPSQAGDTAWAPDPTDPQTHRLPLLPTATVQSPWTGCFDENTGLTPGGTPVTCTEAQLVAFLQSAPAEGLGTVKMHVDGTDHIDLVSLYYHP
ncbi:MAG TPA: hypothetical protein VFG87_19575 [Amycolatopsis sp.]|jgi:hypothetical protein|nr:hypothetical protein [Amycolatopsis sp.]